MKFTLFLLTLLFVNLVKSQSFNDPIKYNDYLIGLQNQIGEKFIAFNVTLGDEKATYETISPVFDQLLLTIDEVILKIEKVTPYEKNVELKNSLLNLIKYYKKTVSSDYKEIIKIIYQDVEKDYDRISVIYEKIVAEEAGYDKVFQDEQKKYAKKYNISLIENNLQDKLDGE